MKGAAGDQVNSGSVTGTVQRAMALTVSAAVPVFWTWVVRTTAVPTVEVPKSRLAGERAMAGAVGAATVKALVATSSQPWSGLFGSGVQRVPKAAPPESYWLPYQPTLQV